MGKTVSCARARPVAPFVAGEVKYLEVYLVSFKSNLRRVAAVGGATAAVVGASVAGPAYAAPVPPKDIVLSVASPSGPMYRWVPGNTGFLQSGGKPIAEPTVSVSSTGMYHYVIANSDGKLYHRTETTGWSTFTPSTWRCTNIASGSFQDQIYVTCRTTQGGVAWMQFPGNQAKPKVTTLNRLGGNVQGEIGVVHDGTEVGLIAKGGTYGPNANQEFGNTYVRAISDAGWTRLGPWCDTPPGATMGAKLQVISCGWNDTRYPQGVLVITDNYSSDTSADSKLVSGKSTDTPGVALTGDGSRAAIFLRGGNGAVYGRTVGYASAGTAWTNFGGIIRWGVSTASTQKSYALGTLSVEKDKSSFDAVNVGGRKG